MEKYEVKGISQSNEIKGAYETAVAENKEFYRAISGSGKVYGWVGGKHALADNGNSVEVDGERWFRNDKYVAPTDEKTDDKVLEEAVEAIEEVIEQPVEEKAEEPVAEKVAETDYKALYEAEVAKVADLESKLIEANNAVEAAKGELEIAKTEFTNYKEIVTNFFGLNK